jgi:hypothetical protein
MEQTIISSRKVIGLMGLIAILIPINARAESVSTVGPTSSAGLAFARYIASIQERNPFTDSGPVGVEIEASLPSLYKETRLVAIRDMGKSERSEYRVLRIEGDAIVAQEVIARYLALQELLEDLPVSSVEITPANYKFKYKGEIGTGGALAYVYEITPKKKRDGLIQGQIWIDSVTGAAILQSGRFVKTPSPFLGKIEVVRDTAVRDGSPLVRITHMTIETPRVGHGELTITEIPLTSIKEEQGTKTETLAQE